MKFLIKGRRLFLLVVCFSNVLLCANRYKLEDISIVGNSKITSDAIISRVSSVVCAGQELDLDVMRFEKSQFEDQDLMKFIDPIKSRQILNLVEGMGYFKPKMALRVEKTAKDRCKIVIFVEEKPILTNFTIEGNSVFSTDKIKKKVFENDRQEDLGVSFFDEFDVEKAKAVIRQMYRKENYLSVEIKDKVEAQPDELSVHFSVIEGRKTKVAKVNFFGVKAFDSGVLREIMRTSESWLLDPITNSGRYDSTMLDVDKINIAAFYRSNGYPRARVSRDDVLSQSDGDLAINLHIQEGPYCTFRCLDLPFDPEISPKVIAQAASGLKSGHPYSAERIRLAAKALEYAFGELGYVSCQVTPVESLDEDACRVDITFKLEKGKKWKTRYVNLFGNLKTHENVIRREILVGEGDLTNRKLLDISKERLMYLGYFSKVDYRLRPVSADQMDIDFIVSEVPKLSNLNFGLQIEEKGERKGGKITPSFDVKLRKLNFGGMGWDFDTAFKHSGRYVSDILFSFRNPHINDGPYGNSIDFYYNKFEYDEKENTAEGYDLGERTWGIGTTFHYEFKPNAHYRSLALGKIGLEGGDSSYPSERISNLEKIIESASNYGDRLRSKYQLAQIGDVSGVWFGAEYQMHSLDSKYSPTKGWLFNADSKFCFGNRTERNGNVVNASSIKLELKSAFYWPLVNTESFKLNFCARGGIGMVDSLFGGSLLKKDLFNIGGRNTVRGFEFAEAGPAIRAHRNERPYPIGAKRMACFSAELSVPVGGGNSRENPVVFAFYDCGAGWNSEKRDLLDYKNLSQYLIAEKFDLRHSVGVGIKLSGAMPIRIDWGYKLNKKPGESKSALCLSMNMPFG